MNWDDTGFLISKNRYNENSIIAEVFTEKHGKFLVLFLVELQKRLKIILQVGNKIYVNYNSRNV